jgi:hypothetical protein
MYMGITVYADDVIILAPNRAALQIMLNKCQTFAEENNILYSTDPDPSKSKSKAMFLCGKAEVEYPSSVTLYGEPLPWVTRATHLGHELSQMCDMELDANIKRARFIESLTKIRDFFSFAHPFQVLQAISTYSAFFYGSNLWDLYGVGATKAFNCWNNCLKRVWNTPLSTHRWICSHLLGHGFPSLRERCVSQYVGFFQKLLTSASFEVRFLANIVGRTVESTTGQNLANIRDEFKKSGLNPWIVSGREVRNLWIHPDLEPNKVWQLELIRELLVQRREMEEEGEEGEEVDFLTCHIDTLCRDV